MRPAGFPATLRLDGLLVVRLWDSRRRCAWTGYWLVVRPVGFPAALRLAGLLVVVGPVGIPGGAAPGRATGWWCGLWDG
ncbi:TPA: hypothetical protein QHQ63_001143 [Klebsiella aerogenes]|nr:hypothetical protein [Klebsiella aerogenes]HDU5289697.1 hypothetical protein [Klebsiella aerogenes]